MLRMKSIRDIIPADDIDLFEAWMEDYSYTYWVELYPECVQFVLAELILFGGIQSFEIMEALVTDLISKGLNLNEKGNYSSKSKSYLDLAAELQNATLLDIFLKNRAKPEKTLIQNIVGYENTNYDNIIKCFKIIEKYNIASTYRKDLFDTLCSIYYKDNKDIDKKDKIVDFIRKGQIDEELDVEDLFGDVKNAAKQ